MEEKKETGVNEEITEEADSLEAIKEEEKKYLPYEDDDEEDGDEMYYHLPKNPFLEKTPLGEETYTIHLEEYEKGFIAFQKKFAYPKNFVMTGLFVVIMALYGQQLYIDPKDGFRWFLFVLCGAMIAGMWINLYSVRKKLMKSLAEIKDDTYTSVLFENGVEITTHTGEDEEEIPATCLLFSNEDLYVLDRADMYILYIKKQMFYIIPKSGMSEENKKLFEANFSGKLGKRYSLK